MRPIALLLLAAVALPASAERIYSPRVFDAVATAGGKVELVDGQTVLRRPGTAFGAVLTFLPESDSQAWIPVAVLNTGTTPLVVGTHRVTARFDGTPLKVWSTTALVRWRKDGRDGLPPAPAMGERAVATRPGLDSVFPTSVPVSPVPPPKIGPSEGAQTQTQSAAGPAGVMNSRSNDEQRATDARRDALDALRERLFREQELAPRTVGRGDVLVALPPRGTAAAPAEFVLTLAFGGETMDVLYRERMPPAE